MKTAHQIAIDVQSGAGSAESELERTLGVIAARNEELNVFLHVDEDGARSAAASIDARVAKGENVGPLAGVPIAIKDNMCQRGIPTTCSSKILEGWRPPYNATVIDLLLAAGAVFVLSALCWRRGWMGGGDVKLLGAAALGMHTCQAVWFRADDAPAAPEPDFRAFTQMDVLTVVKRLS